MSMLNPNAVALLLAHNTAQQSRIRATLEAAAPGTFHAWLDAGVGALYVTPDPFSPNSLRFIGESMTREIAVAIALACNWVWLGSSADDIE